MLYKSIWDEFDNVDLSVQKPNPFTTIHLMKTQPDFPFFDLKNTSKTESIADLINNTFGQAIDSLKRWKEANESDGNWGTFKGTEINHLISFFTPFNVTNIDIGGYSNIVNAASKHHGPSWRMVVDMDPDGIKAYGVYPGSQTGNPGNPKYAHMIESWAEGSYYELNFGGNELNDDEIIQIVNLKPKQK
jgi:penicillin amidase